MSILLIHGNTNIYTFGNSIVAANKKAIELFNKPFTDIYVIHSRESKDVLSKSIEWQDYITKNNINFEIFTDRIIEIDSTEKSIQKFVDYIEKILKGLKSNTELLIDLSNGTTVQKNLLSIASYILDLKFQYMIDISILSQITNERKFIEPEILIKCYVNVPDSTLLDNIAYLNLSQVIRYKKIIDTHTNNFINVDTKNSDDIFFKDNLLNSIQLKLQGDQRKDNAVYRIAGSSIAGSIEELLGLLIEKFIGSADKKTFGQKIQIIENEVTKRISNDFDIEFFKLFNDFMLYLRNSSTHKGKLMNNFEKFKADLSVKMSFPFIEFYTEIIHPILEENQEIIKPKQISKLVEREIKENEVLYYGLDGDNTGKILEELFISSSNENKFKTVSKSISNAIDKIANYINSKEITGLSNKDRIIFKAGDDLLFKGNYEYTELKEMQKIYEKETSALTCSIGYGRSFQEVYIALKMAKTEVGKNSIRGIKIQ